MALLALVLTNCSMEEQLEMDPQPAASSTCRSLTDAQIEQLGVQHNEALTAFFENFDYSSSDYNAELVAQMMGANVADLSNADKQYVLGLEMDFEASIGELPNAAQVSGFTNQIEEAILNSATINVMEAEFSGIELNARQNLDCGDLEVVLSMLSVSRHSAHFWLPASQGGSGEGQVILEGLGVPPSAARDIVRADGQGVATACIRFAVFAAFGGPAGAGALFGGMIFAGAAASAWAALG